MTGHAHRVIPQACGELPAGREALRVQGDDYALILSRARACLEAETPQAPVLTRPVRRALTRTVTALALSSVGVASFAVSANVEPAKAAAPSNASGDFAPPNEINIRLGRTDPSIGLVGRLEIYGSIGSRASVRRNGDKVIIRLASKRRPIASDLVLHPPEGVSKVELSTDGRAYEITLTLKDKADVHFGRADGAVFVQVVPPDNGKAPGKFDQALKEVLNPAKPAPVPKPAEGKPVTETPAPAVAKVDVVPVSARLADDGAFELNFAFANPAGAAVFRRGGSVWVVFDREVDLRLPVNLKDSGLIDGASWVRNDGVTALRLKASSVGAVTAVADSLSWRVRLGGRGPEDAKATEIGLTRDDTSGESVLVANLAGASKIAWIRDPDVGDRLAVVTARGPVKAVSKDRVMLQATVASTAHGLAFERMTPDLKVTIDGDLVSLSSPTGLLLSQAKAAPATRQQAALDFAPAAYPSLMDEAGWSKLPADTTFLQAYNNLQAKAADEAALGGDAPIAARLALARFLVGQKLYYEAQGLLDLLIRKSPRASDNAQVRGLRVIAKVSSGRIQSAEADLDSGALASDPAANLWRGYLAAKAGHWPDARKAFASGAMALDRFPPMWRTRFAAANAMSALKTNDLKTAQSIISYAIKQDVEPLEKLDALLVAGEIIEASGDKMRALGVFSEISKASLGRISTPAMMHAAKLKLELGKSSPQQALETLDGLRFRWRGDDTELDIIGSLGDIYLNAGRYREALNVLKSGGQKFARNPDALNLSNRLNAAFRGLFLQGMADGLQPIEALGLFYDYQDLTPVGSDGDEMVRKLARRLIDVDLLDQAATLLQYQIDNRLDGVAKAAVATDLAAIHLMNRQPEKALQALWKTRTSLLPKPLMSERRVLEARALTQINRLDDALDALATDNSPDAMDVRADVYWQQKDWTKAAQIIEKRLGERYKSDAPLSLADESRLIRAGVALSLLSDQKGLDRLSLRYGKFIEKSQSPDALRVALAGMDDGPMAGKDFALAAAQADSFTAWVSNMKQRLRDRAKTPLPPSGQGAARPTA